jgi:hypothetical protein
VTLAPGARVALNVPLSGMVALVIFALTVPVTAALTLPVTGNDALVMFALTFGVFEIETAIGGSAGVLFAAVAGWLERDARTTATTTNPNIKSIDPRKRFMEFLL